MSDISSETPAPAAPEMKVDLIGRIANTSVLHSHAFLPLFEAIINSIHATEERFGDEVTDRGRVEVLVERIPSEPALPGMPGRPPVERIASFTVVDNGCGFTDRNLEAFATADSTAKADRGGKGVGRFTWLVVFDEALLESVFLRDGEGRCRRSFRFSPTTRGIEDYREATVSDSSAIRTSVKLLHVRSRYVEDLRLGGDAIADRIFEHCFNYFVLGRCPQIHLLENSTDSSLNILINARLQEVVVDAPARLTIGEHELELLHVQRKHVSGRKHEAHLCANRRVVESFSLAEHSQLGAEPFHNDAGESVVQHAFVSGPALDAAVNSTRTRIDLPDGSPVLEAMGELDLKTVRDRVGKQVDDRLSRVLQAEREETLRRVTELIRTEKPEFRPLIAHRAEALERLRWTDDVDRMDERLYRLQQSWEADVRTRQREVEQKLVGTSADPEEFAEELYRVIAEVNEAGQASLVRYVAKRRAVLNILHRLISVTSGPALEAHVHRVVFPLRRTADQIAYDDHNLWLVDDTLSFYEFVASDLPMAQSEVVPSDSQRRPDILAFKTGEPPYQHVAIVELKQPEGRENPVQQLVDYALLLRDGGSRNAKGQSMLGVPRSVRIDAYAICTFTAKVEQELRRGPIDMQKVAEEGRWYGAKATENLWIEVLDFQTFIRRAEQRNRAFFTKLGLT